MSKREVPSYVDKLLSYDVLITKNVVTYLLQFNASNKLRKHCKFLEYSCNGVVWLATWLAFIWILDNPAHYAMQLNLMVGLILDIIIVACVKAFVRRRRPTPCEDMMTLGPDKFSFPSGHASRAAYLLLFFLYVSPVSWFLWLPITIWALGIFVSRIALQRHYLLDVICGVSLGLIEALLISWIWLSPQAAASLIGLMSNDGATVEMEV